MTMTPTSTAAKRLAGQLTARLDQFLRESVEESLGALLVEALRQERVARDEVRAWEDRDEIPPKQQQLSWAKAEARAAALLDAWEAVVGEPYSAPLSTDGA